jgi:Flp pilus assembly protein TadG
MANLARARSIRRFLRAEEGAALVEFAVVLPMMLLVFAVIIEGSRLMMSYHAAISGVRDATRFLARVAPGNICATGGSVASYASQLQTIVSQSTSGASVFPPAVTVNSVTPTLACVSGTYRLAQTPIATVTANVTITHPFASFFALFGAAQSPVTTTISDSTKVYGT